MAGDLAMREGRLTESAWNESRGGATIAPAPDIPKRGDLRVRPALTGDIDGHLRQPDERWYGPQVRPWVRSWARGLDNSIVMAVAYAVYFATGPWQWSWWLFLLPYVALPIAALSVYPFQLVLFGRTIGKSYYGIKVLNENGKTPTLTQAMRREWRVLVDGMGIGLAVLPLGLILAALARLNQPDLRNRDEAIVGSLVLFWLAVGIMAIPMFTHFAAYRRLMQDGATSWDRSCDLVVRHRPATLRIIASFVPSTALCAALAIWVARYQPAPQPAQAQPPRPLMRPR
jgi:uncharacterized RDD family membrane protein YckC